MSGNEKNLRASFVHKHAPESYWNSQSDFVPKAGEIIFYEADSSHFSARFKLGDGIKSVVALPFISSDSSVADAMQFKGTIGSPPATATVLPADHLHGWTYKVATAGIYAGQNCEIGDLIICITDGTVQDNSHWTVVQNNIDGSVTGPVLSSDNSIAVFNGTSGRLIKDSGYTIEASVPQNAEFTDTKYTLAIDSSDDHKLNFTGSDGTSYAIILPDDSTVCTLETLGIGNVKNYDQSKAIKTIERSGTTYTYTCLDGTTGTFNQQDLDTKYSILQDPTDTHKLTFVGTDGTSTVILIPDDTTIYTLETLGIGNVKNYDQSKAIKSISRTGTTFNYTCLDNTTGTFDQQDTWTVMTGAASNTDGSTGTVPSPVAGDNTKFLRGDGTWSELQDDEIMSDAVQGQTTLSGVLSALIESIGTKGVVNSVCGKTASSIDLLPSDVHIVYSETEPQNPSEGMIWITPLE